MFQNLCVRITTGALLLSSAVLFGCSSSERQTSPTADSANAAPPAQTAPPADTGSAAGVKVFRDPATGEIREPTDLERAALERQDGKLTTAEPRTQTESKLRSGRGTSITLDNEPGTPIQACTNADGTVVVGHDCEPAKKPQQDK